MTLTNRFPFEPTFVFGALRSGTTFFRLMLNTHPNLINPGEVDFLFDHLHQNSDNSWYYDLSALRDDRIFQNYDLALADGLDGLDLLGHMLAQFHGQETERLSLNVHRNAAKMALALPQARFIHLLRDPRDVARSSIGMGWAGNGYHGAAHWIRTETGWGDAKISEERVLTVRFETLITGIEAELTRICEFLGVRFDPKMLDYHQGTNFGPPDPDIAFAWKRKASAKEIALIEGRLGTLLIDRGYTPHDAPRYPNALELRSLRLENRIKRWQFNMRRYGIGLFLMTHTARVLGLKTLHQQLRQRQEDMRTAKRK